MSILPTKESQFLTSIKSGHFSYKRKPHIVKLYDLEKAVNKIGKAKLAKEIAFCLCSYPYERFSQERYFIAFNSIAISNWDEVAVVQLKPSINCFSDIVCINYKVINNKQFRLNNKLFIELLLHEIKLLNR